MANRQTSRDFPFWFLVVVLGAALVWNAYSFIAAGAKVQRVMASPTGGAMGRVWDWLGLWPTLACAIGLVTVFSWKRKRTDHLRQLDELGERLAGALSPGRVESGAPPSVQCPSGLPGDLAPAADRGRNFRVITVVAMLWNGLVWVFLWAHFTGRFDPSSSAGDLSSQTRLVLFLGMGGIGLFLLQCWGSSFLNLFNPRVHLRIHDPVTAAGKPLTLSWRITGPLGKMGSLTIHLEGSEEIDDERGSETTTKTAVFVRWLVAETTTPSLMRSGRTQVHIPREATPSRSGSSRRIVWALQVHGRMNSWPDFRETFPVELRPAGSAERGFPDLST